MDLKSILSPTDESRRPPSSTGTQSSNSSTPAPPPAPAPAPAASLPVQSPQKRLERVQPGPSVPSIARAKHVTSAGSPLSRTPLSSLPSHVMSPLNAQTSSPLISPVPVTPGTPHVQRTSSTQSMDTLADLASAQANHPIRPPVSKGNSLESIKSADSTSRFAIAQVALTSNPRASFDINMMDTTQQIRKTNFGDTALPQAQKERLTELALHLAETPSAYEVHVALINLLHQAFINHVFPTSDNGHNLPKNNPSTFELLGDLRIAREIMSQLFSVGEEIWLNWLQDESMLARTTEERIDVIEKFRKAVTEEPSSSKLWSAYGDWILECYRWSSEGEGATEIDEDKLVAREVFSWQMVLETWQEAVEHTKKDIANSHLVWNKFIQVRLSEFKNNISKDQATRILGLFEQRLKVPHIASDSTKQILSSFMNTHFSQEQYFEIMEDTARIMRGALKALEERSYYEAKIEEAQTKTDSAAEYSAFVQYIDWEKTPAKRKRLDFESCNALYERAELRFPSDSSLWEDHIAFILENTRPALDTLSRATSHCPWSGTLWSQYLLTSDRLGQSYEQTEHIKHQATSTGALEAAGIEEVLKVHSAWCSYLRRRAFRLERDEDDADIAEIGIRTSMESTSGLGVKLGVGEAPDPTFRLQRIYINFLSEMGRWDNARREFDNGVRNYGKSWQFWVRFYLWEMKRWRRFSTQDPAAESLVASSPPHLATAVLKAALDQDGLDYPEPIIEALINHCEDYEGADELQACLLKVRKLEKVLAARRQIEAIQTAQAAAIQQVQTTETDYDTLSRPQLSKRKRDDFSSDETLHEDVKRNKTDEAISTVEQTQPDNLARDRENATVLVENLPEHISEAKVRQFFSNCGTVKALKILENGTSVIVEFDDDQAARYALSRDGQQFENATISVVLDTGSTVFMTNYAPDAGETEIRKLLDPFGEILSVRMPSLQGNKRRRFCYAQFKLPVEAQTAVDNLDGKEIDGLPLTCKVSNPAIRKSRQETTVNDGRTVFIGRLNFKASEAEVKNEFSQFGKIELIRMPLHETMKNRNKGIAFVTFTSTNEAQAALQMNGKMVKGREIKVEMASDNQNRSVRHQSSAPAHANDQANARSTSPTSTLVSSGPRSERTVFLTNVPDTVNEAQLRKVAREYGDVIKVVLKTNHQGALVEYGAVAQAGEASLGLDGQEIAPGRHIKVVSEAEMKVQGPEKKAEGFASKLPNTTAAPASGFIKRPTQPGNRARKGGNLGRRSTLLHTSAISHEPHKELEQGSNGTNKEEDGVKKSNADFRALMSGENRTED